MTSLRGIAQSFGVPDIFNKSREQLVKLIEMAQEGMAPKPDPTPEPPAYDARLMSKPPAKRGSQEEIENLLAEHVDRGLHLTFPMPEHWHMRFGDREDSGTMRQPLISTLRAANALMRPK